MHRSKISVIVPVYNIEKYISQCLQSIAAQDYADYDVIIIDDGSTDKSADVVASFINENGLDNFRLVKKENGGIVEVRNLGLSLATGEWISFVDGDDWVEPQYLSAMWAAIEASGADLCYSGYRAYDESSKTYEVWSSFSDGSGTMPDDIKKLFSFSTVWAHLYKKSIIIQNSLIFDKDISCEDYAFNLDYNSHISSFCMTGQVLYNYRINREGQLTKKLVHPIEKKVLHKHMQRFLSSIDEKYVLCGLAENERLCRIVWNDLYNYVTNCILDKKYNEAHSYLKTPIAKETIKRYKVRTKKEKLFRTLMKLPMWCLIPVVVVYYKNYEKLRRGRFLQYMSKN